MNISSLPARAARAIVNRIVGHELRVVRVVSGVARGRRLQLDLSVEKAYWLGHYERVLQRLLRETVAPGDVVYDVGAHVGFFSVCAAALGAHVVAVEPDPVNAARLRTNVELNGLDISVVEGAAWHETGSVKLVAGDSPKEFHATVGTGTASVTLDELSQREGAPSLIKLDVEGAEAEVLRGARTILAVMRPTVVCELHGETERLHVLGLLGGYRVEPLDGPQRIVARPQEQAEQRD